MKPSFVIYGNCQAGILQYAVRHVPGIKDEFDIHYIRSFDHPGEENAAIDPDVMQRCKILWKQYDELSPFSYAGPLADGAKTITFPPMDFAPLWPFQVKDSEFVPELPDFPFGKFPYGDRLAIEFSETNKPSEELIHYYTAHAQAKLIQFDRMLDIEFQRLARREANCNVSIAAFVFSRMRDTRLFWSFNHPTRHLLCELMNRLAIATWTEARDKNGEFFQTVDRIFLEWEPLDSIHVPITGAVARGLDLKWWEPNLLYNFHNLKLLKEKEYIKLYIDSRRTYKSSSMFSVG